MSPARSRRRPAPNRRNRADVIKAVGVAVGIMVGTALVVWLMRPGPTGQPLGTGGIVNRQPRMSWLIVIALALAAIAAWWILRVSRRTKGHEKVALPIAFGAVAIAAVIGGVLWPGGVLLHVHALPQAITPNPVSSTIPPNATASTTSGPAVTTTSTGTSSTGTTATSNPGGTAPTSSATTTTITGTSTTAGP